MTGSIQSSTACYDLADKLISSSDSQIGTPTYDDHGNTISLAGAGVPIVFSYDALDNNIKIEQGTNRVEYVKTASGVVLRKKEYRNGVLEKSYRYVSGGGILQSCSLADDNSCANLDTYLSLPGNVMLTRSPSNPDIAKRVVYSLRNYHSDTALTLNASGVATTALLAYGPFGESLATGTLGSATTLSNSSNESMGWAANPRRKAESLFSVPIIQMGARVYLPTLGRFLQKDPVPGGTANDYVYVSDPINYSDYNGMWGVPKWGRWVAAAVAVVAVAVVVVVAAAVAIPAVAVATGISLTVGAAIAVGVAAGAVAGAAIHTAVTGKINKGTLIAAGVGAVVGGAIVGASALVGGAAITAGSGVCTSQCDRLTGGAANSLSPAQKGLQGIQQAGVVQNTEKIVAPSGRVRVPDVLTKSNGTITAVGEVKNTASLSYTSQLRDYVGIASSQPNGVVLDLYVRTNTRLSGPLQNAVEQGLITLHPIIGE